MMMSPAKKYTENAVVDKFTVVNLESAATNSEEHEDEKPNCLCSTCAIVAYVAIFSPIFVFLMAFWLGSGETNRGFKVYDTFNEIDVADGASVRFSYGEIWNVTNWNENDCIIDAIASSQLRIRPVNGTDGCKDVEITAIRTWIQVSRFTASSNASIEVDGYQGGRKNKPSIPTRSNGEIQIDVSSSGSVTFQGGVIRKITGSVDGKNSKVTYVQEANVNTTDVKSVIQCKNIETTNGGTLKGFDDVSDDCSN